MPKTRRWRRGLRFAALNIALLVALLAAVEIVLRLTAPDAGNHHPAPSPDAADFTMFEKTTDDQGVAVYRNGLADPARFARGPIHKITADGTRFTVEVPFAPAEFAVEKTPDTFRIFLLGSSPIYSYWDGGSKKLDLGRVLHERLTTALPSIRWDVINGANKAFDQDTMLVLLREILNYQPDLIAVYVGNVSPMIDFGYDRQLVFSSSFTNPVVQWVVGTRIFQTLLAPRLFAPGDPVGGRDLMTGARTHGDTDAHALETAKRNLHEIFRRKSRSTMTRMTDAAQQAGVPLAFFTIVTDHTRRPSRSWFADGVSPADRERVRRLLETPPGPNQETNLREALAIDPGYAATLYRLGMVLRRQGLVEESTRLLDQAVRRDAAGERVDFLVNPELRRLARQRGVALIDLEEALEVPRGGNPDYFMDHSHFSRRGMEVVADEAIKWLRSSNLLRD